MEVQIVLLVQLLSKLLMIIHSFIEKLKEDRFESQNINLTNFFLYFEINLNSLCKNIKFKNLIITIIPQYEQFNYI